MADPHPDVAVPAPLLGSWRGRGAGAYPTIEPFDYVEEATFGHVEWIIAHPNGIAEVQEGTVSVHTGIVELDVVSSAIARTASAKLVESLTRTARIDGDALSDAVLVGAVGEPLQPHLAATLHRERPT